MSDWKRYCTGGTPREGESRPTAKGWYHTYRNGAEHSEDRYFDGVKFENTAIHGIPDWWCEAEIPTTKDNHGFHQGTMPDEPGWYLGWDNYLSCPHAFYKDEHFAYWRCHPLINGKVCFAPHTPQWWKKDVLPELPELLQQNK